MSGEIERGDVSRRVTTANPSGCRIATIERGSYLRLFTSRSSLANRVRGSGELPGSCERTRRRRFQRTLTGDTNYPPPRYLKSCRFLLSPPSSESFSNFFPAFPDAKYSFIASTSGIIARLAVVTFLLQANAVGTKGSKSNLCAPAKNSLLTMFLKTLRSPGDNLSIFPVMTLRASAFACQSRLEYCGW